MSRPPRSSPLLTSYGINGLVVGPYLQCILLPQSLWLCHRSLRCPTMGRVWYNSQDACRPLLVCSPSQVPHFLPHVFPNTTHALNLSSWFFPCILTIRQVPQDEQLCLPSSVPGHRGCRAAQWQVPTSLENLVHSGAAPGKSRSLSSPEFPTSTATSSISDTSLCFQEPQCAQVPSPFLTHSSDLEARPCLNMQCCPYLFCTVVWPECIT